jgi:predicted transcriptional regulator
MKKLFLKVKPCAVLLLLKDSNQVWYPSKLARSAGISYVHTVNLLSQLSAMGAVTSEKKGKQNFYKLTEKGAHIALSLEDFSKKCDSLEQEAKQQKAEEKPAAQSSDTPAQKP